MTGTRETEGVHRLRTADTHDTLLFFTDRGRVFSLKCYKIPEDTSRTAKGTPLVKLLSLDEREQVTEILPISSFVPDSFVVMATRSGQIKKTALEKFSSVRSNGLIANKLRKDDELVAVSVARPDDDVIVVTERGQSIRFAVAALRAASRSSGGVRAIHLTAGDHVVAMDITSPDAYLLIVTVNGYGKCTLLTRYRTQSRGGMGIKSISISAKSGGVAAARVIDPSSEELMILSTKGVIIRLRMDSVPIQGRIRKGASLMRLDEGDEVASIAAFSQSLS